MDGAVERQGPIQRGCISSFVETENNLLLYRNISLSANLLLSVHPRVRIHPCVDPSGDQGWGPTYLMRVLLEDRSEMHHRFRPGTPHFPIVEKRVEQNASRRVESKLALNGREIQHLVCHAGRAVML